jgi:hypothetical protein
MTTIPRRSAPLVRKAPGPTVYDAVVCGEPVDFTPFVDVHGHFGSWGATFIPHAMDCQRAIAEMDRYGCDMVWMSASEPGFSDTMAAKNECVFGFADRYPDRIIPYCTLSSNEPDRCLSELRRCLARGRCIGVKMHRGMQPEYTLRSEFLQPVLELLAERKLVYMNHDLGDVETISWATQQFPELTFVEGHFNPSRSHLSLEHRNYLDCTCAALAPDAVATEVRRLGRSDALLVGSDFSLFSLSFGIGMVAYAEIPEEDKRNILGLNALRLLERTDWFHRSMIRTVADDELA